MPSPANRTIAPITLRAGLNLSNLLSSNPEAAANASPSRSSLELARQGAIDNSGIYKDTYLSSNSYGYTPSTYIPTYDPSKYESTYTPDTTTPSRSDPPSAPPPTSTAPPSSTGGVSSGGSEQTDPYAALDVCLAETRSLPTEALRARAVQGCYQNHTP